MKKHKIAISIGDLNGVGIEIALRSHEKVKKLCEPIYCINKTMLKQASEKLKLTVPKDFTLHPTKGDFTIKPSEVTKKSGQYSYNSFLDAIALTHAKKTQAVVTLPINKQSWSKAGIKFKGHTDVLRDLYGNEAIMMLGCPKMFVALFTDHIPLKKVPQKIKEEKLTEFLINLYKSLRVKNIQVLALNPHASDNGVLGDEEIEIIKAIKNANKIVDKKIFEGPLVPDTAFTKFNRKKHKYFVAMHHDQGLIPLKALHFEESINVSLNLPIIRTSVDHGTAFDIAYKNAHINTKSYLNAIKEAVVLSQT
jgi:4-hydroxythreonine-4-phosphate dehydrogenase